MSWAPGMLSGIKGRVASKPPVPSKIRRRKFQRFVQRYIASNLEPLPPDTDFDFETWLANTNYSNARKTQLRVRYDEIKSDPGLLETKKFARVKMFIKEEFYEKIKKPRVIYARSDYAKCYFGPVVKCMEHVVYKLPQFVKHIPVRDRARYIHDRFDNKCHQYITTDYTSFERHFTKDVYEIVEFQVYKYLLSNVSFGIEWLKRYKRCVSHINRCCSKWFNCNILATRMSGEMTTSLGNGLANLLIFEFLNQGHEHDCVVEGDDLLGYTYNFALTAEDYTRLGFTVKLEMFTELNKAAFCQLVFDVKSYTVVPNIIKTLLKLPYGPKRMVECKDQKLIEMFRGKLLCAMAQYPGTPIIQPYCAHMLKLVGEGKVIHVDDPYKLKLVGNDYSQRDITHETRLLVQQVQGITIAEQEDLEKEIETFTLEPTFSPAVLSKCPNVLVDSYKYIQNKNCVYVWEFNKNIHGQKENQKFESFRKESYETLAATANAKLLSSGTQANTRASEIG